MNNFNLQIFNEAVRQAENECLERSIRDFSDAKKAAQGKLSGHILIYLANCTKDNEDIVNLIVEKYTVKVTKSEVMYG